MKDRYLIVTVSLGNRPWRGYTIETMRRYCRHHGFDMEVVDDVGELNNLNLPALSDSLGRKSKHIYALKTYVAWKYLAIGGYERVAVLDDSCSIIPGCPSLFDVVPRGALGGTGTSSLLARKSFEHIARLVKDGTLCDPVKFDEGDYLKSGLLVYDSSMIQVVEPARIRSASDLLYNKSPHQTMTYYLFKSRNVPVCVLPDEFLWLPKRGYPPEERKRTIVVPRDELESAHVCAVSGAYKYRFWLASSVAIKALYVEENRRLERLGSIRYMGSMAVLLARISIVATKKVLRHVVSGWSVSRP